MVRVYSSKMPCLPRRMDQTFQDDLSLVFRFLSAHWQHVSGNMCPSVVHAGTLGEPPFVSPKIEETSCNPRTRTATVVVPCLIRYVLFVCSSLPTKMSMVKQPTHQVPVPYLVPGKYLT